MDTEKKLGTTKLIAPTHFMAEIYNCLTDSIKQHPFLNFTNSQ
jgi:hypothetical protein